MCGTCVGLALVYPQHGSVPGTNVNLLQAIEARVHCHLALPPPLDFACARMCVRTFVCEELCIRSELTHGEGAYLHNVRVKERRKGHCGGTHVQAGMQACMQRSTGIFKPQVLGRNVNETNKKRILISMLVSPREA